jgi:hypothetical protein
MLDAVIKGLGLEMSDVHHESIYQLNGGSQPWWRVLSAVHAASW